MSYVGEFPRSFKLTASSVANQLHYLCVENNSLRLSLKIRICYRNRCVGGRGDVISKRERVNASENYFVCCCAKSISLTERDQPPPFLDLPRIDLFMQILLTCENDSKANH
ncbi:hypothetical protein T10_9403 [Trichinella papuae]|uniref:Uncharacterized protein n=1 Tax=Trichinella papuae TaxID=268474 RepID=A0A0V1N2G6_9BILA|nr:hypothetical protein T10_9403 [Trichinella papuae]